MDMSSDVAHVIVVMSYIDMSSDVAYAIVVTSYMNTSLYRRGNQKYQRRTDNTLAKEKSANNDLKSTTQKI